MINQKKLKKLFNYNEDTGVFTRRVSVGNCKAGNTVGYVNSKTGYMSVVIEKRSYYIHRLAWLYKYGKFPKNQIDHKDRVKTNNRIENLRDVTHSENQKNKNRNKNNISGTSGVIWNKSREEWQSSICVEGKRKHLGWFKDIDDAIASREEAEIKYKYDTQKHLIN